MKIHTVNQANSVGPDIISQESKHVLDQSSLSLLAILAISVLVNLSIRIDYLLLGTGLGEVSATESLQLVMLSITAWSFYRISKQQQQLKHAALLISGFFAVLLIREMDYWLDMLRHGSWVYPALLITVLACTQAYQGGKETVNEMATLLQTPYMKLLIGAVVLLLVFSRLYGMGSFWKQVMDVHYVREVKNISEEAIELLSYCLIALSAVRTQRELKQ
ncbi:hypothetical protein [Vibrio sp. CAU 1672]|uniref:hypothetical protein n=1 Tax=Vibrio sp. CAU 1672 TaxID=3032594 RepID=UPI0023DADDBE|nr:hypothetical protein [Vibrio sp. CAU 1672]MDF2152576.1 hypothetical protein [Vibrio sp. CAU 1672]